MNIANQVTLSRIALSFICMWLIVKDNLVAMIISFIIFIIAALTDYWDGYLARKYNLISDWGKLWDPIADKVLILGVFLAFLALGVVNMWVVIVIMFREFAITGMRFICLKKGVVVEAKMVGKHKTVSQIAGIILIFLALIIIKSIPESFIAELLSDYIIPFALWYIIIITIYSGAVYVWDNRKLIGVI